VSGTLQCVRSRTWTCRFLFRFRLAQHRMTIKRIQRFRAGVLYVLFSVPDVQRVFGRWVATDDSQPGNMRPYADFKMAIEIARAAFVLRQSLCEGEHVTDQPEILTDFFRRVFKFLF